MSEHSKERKIQEKPEKENNQTMICAEGSMPAVPRRCFFNQF